MTRAADELLLKKFEDHRSFTAAIAVLAGTVFAALWIWDYVVDPIGARGTGLLRLCFAPPFYLYALLALRMRTPTVSFAVGLVATWIAIALFIAILNRLHTGMIYGIAGFMYAGMLGIIGFHAYSLKLNWLYTVSTALLPHAIAFAGYAPGFQHLQYGVLIWPAAVMSGIAQYMVAANYRQRYALERTLQQASNTDALTGVNNRRYFFPRMEQEIMRSRRTLRPLSLIMVDIDFFKRINDTHGHPVGDMVIRQLAQMCIGVVRETDVVARLGGEEFAILLPDTGIDGATVTAERLRAMVEAASVEGALVAPVFFTVSVGVDQMRNGDRQPDEIFNRADNALYRAKHLGRNRVVAYDDSAAPAPVLAAR
ncbi:MAG TPA: GGDEF domain-containing protein [Burkholderiaceae bacterium]